MIDVKIARHHSKFFAEEDWNKMADKTGGPFHRKPLDRRFVKQVGKVKTDLTNTVPKKLNIS
jgi:hypothetical protein